MTVEPIRSLKCLGWKIKIPLEVLRDLADNAVHHYEPFYVKRPGKRPRRIDNPDKPLRNAQKRIDRILLKPYIFPAYLHGGIRGRSPQTNALPHLGQRWVVRVDLKDFYPSITDGQVHSVWKHVLGHIPPVAGLLTSLTTYHGYLPQGSPTSSSLANLALLNADKEIYAAAIRVGCSFTRYVDDLVFSGNSPQELIQEVVRILMGAGFRISRQKLKMMPSSSLQEITGLAANSRSGPSVPRSRRDQARASIGRLRNMPMGSDFDQQVQSAKGLTAYIGRTNPGSGKRLKGYLENVLSARIEGC